jgi:CheY-like chemotaxis protein
MKIKTLVLGDGSFIQSVSNSLIAMGAEVVSFYELPEAVTVLKQDHYNLAVVDGTLDDIVNVCFRLIWICRLRVAVAVAAQDVQSTYKKLEHLGIDTFITDQYEQSEFNAKITAIALKGPCEFDKSNVLLIEDDKHVQEALKLYFHIFWAEAELTCCNDGLNGVNTAKKKVFDLILLDLGLPDMDGFEVLSWIRLFSNVPVVILTAQRDKEQILRALQSGASDYIVKPFKQIDLMLRLQKAMKSGRVHGITQRVKLNLG